MSSRLVVAEVVLATVLLAASALLGRDVLRVSSAGLGFNPQGILSAELPPSHIGQTAAQVAALVGQLRERGPSLPGAGSCVVTRYLPGGEVSPGAHVQVEGWPHDTMRSVVPRVVTPGYFSMLSIPLLAGRDFSDRDTATSQNVVVVNEALASFYFGGARQALGRQIVYGRNERPPSGTEPNAKAFTVVGVVGSIRERGMQAGPATEVYWPFAQAPSERVHPRTYRPSPMYVLISVRGGNEARLAGPFRELLKDISPFRPVCNVMPLSRLASTRLARQQLIAMLMGAFSGLSLALAIIGLYGVLAYSVTLRRREMAIRLAVGGTPRRVLALVMTQSVRLVAVGIGIGLPIAVAWTWFSSSRVFAVSTADPLVLTVVALVVTLGGLGAAALPAWRAATVEPSTALHEE